MLMNGFDSVDKLFFTLTVVVLTTNVIYLFMNKLNRPIVLGGVFAGVLIHHMNISPMFFDINTCAGLGQMGIVLFMMLVGNQLSYRNLFQRKIYMSVTLLNMLIPFILGFIVAGYLVKYQMTGYYDPNVSMTPDYYAIKTTQIANHVNAHVELMFKVFVGLAVSMTAFPILSMFLTHTNLTNTVVGRIALLCGFVAEIVFWVVLGIILVTTQKNMTFTWFKPFDIVFYIIFITLVAPRLISYIVSKIKTERTMLGFMVVGCFAFAALADTVDLHQVFGGFIFGLLLPRGNPLIDAIRIRLSDLVNVTLLPIYFVQTGIVANIHFAVDPLTLYLAGVFTLIALVGKFSGGFITGKILGLSNSDSSMLGSLLNMRGIIEIVLLNVGLDIGLISEKMYTILIIMTLICTFIATTFSLKFGKGFAQKVQP